MERLDLIMCKDKKILIDYINQNSNIKVFEQMGIELLKNIALNIPVIKKIKEEKETKKQKKE
jgi:glucose-6-phosphate isomerase